MKTTNAEGLPTDCQFVIFEYLLQPYPLLYVLPYVCRTWCQTLGAYSQVLWRRVCRDRWPIVQITEVEPDWKQFFLVRVPMNSPYLHLELAGGIEKQLCKIKEFGHAYTVDKSVFQQSFSAMQELNNRMLHMKDIKQRYKEHSLTHAREYKQLSDQQYLGGVLDQRRESLFLRWLISHDYQSVDATYRGSCLHRRLRLCSPAGRSIKLSYTVNREIYVIDSVTIVATDVGSCEPFELFNSASPPLLAHLKRIYHYLQIQHLGMSQFWYIVARFAPTSLSIDAMFEDTRRYDRQNNSMRALDTYDIRFVNEHSETYYAEGIKYLSKVPTELVHAPDKYKRDKKLILELMKKEASVLDLIDPTLLLDLDVIHHAYQLDPGLLLEYFPADVYESDEDIQAVLSEVIMERPSLLRFASEEQKDSTELVARAVSFDGELLKFASKRHQNDVSLILAALRSKYVDLESIQQLIVTNESIQKAALQVATGTNIIELLRYHPELEDDKKFIVNLMNAPAGSQFIRYSSQFLDDREVMLQALSITNHLSFTRYLKVAFSEMYSDDKDFIAQCLASENPELLPDLLELISERLRQDRSIVLSILKLRHLALYSLERKDSTGVTASSIFKAEKRAAVAAQYSSRVKTNSILSRMWKQLGQEEIQKYQHKAQAKLAVIEHVEKWREKFTVSRVLSRRLKSMDFYRLQIDMLQDEEVQMYLSAFDES